MSTLKVDNLTDTAAAATVPIEDVVNGTFRIWCKFNGTGTIAIDDSYNVSSLTDNGAGNYTVNFGITMPDANYAAFFDKDNALTAGTGYASHEYFGTYSTTACQLRFILPNGTAPTTEPSIVTFGVVGNNY